MPEKPIAASWARKWSRSMNGSVPLTPASTGVRVATGQHLAAHLDHDLVGVAVGQEAGERAAAGHAVAAGIVDHDQVDAAGLLAAGREAGAGAAADDRLAALPPWPGSAAMQLGAGESGASGGDLAKGGDQGRGERRDR